WPQVWWWMMPSWSFNDHDGIIHHQTCGQGNAEQRQRVDGEPEQLGENESPDQRDGNGNGGEESAPPALRKKEEKQKHHQEGSRHGPLQLPHWFPPRPSGGQTHRICV